MKIVKAYPPNFTDILTAIPAVKLKRNIIFTYGDTIYNPAGNKLPADLIAHEEVHQRQQERIGIEEWWRNYLTRDTFRVVEELEAYKVQAVVIQQQNGRDMRRKKLKAIIKDFSGSMYGGIISPDEAKELIIGGTDEQLL